MPKKKAEAVEAPEECRRYGGPRKEEVLKLCAEYGVKALAAMNVVELAQLMDNKVELEEVEVVLAEIRRLAGVAPRPVNVLEALKAQQALPVLKTGVSEFDEKTPWGGLRRG
jgi:DNA repair protein RadA